MGMTATQLGRLFSRSAAEMNRLLRDHGFIEGGPGAWRPTELGKAFAQAHDFDNGYGGFAHRQWGWLSWTDGITDALKASLEANPNGITPPAPAPTVVSAAPSMGTGGGSQSGNNKWVALVALAGIAASTPAARRAWHEKVKPAASKARARIAERKSAENAPDAVEPDPEE